MISLIVCMDQQQGIGIGNQLPWHLPEDLKHFKKSTLGHPVVMGRKTFESIGKPLPHRTNIILSTNPSLRIPESCLLYNSIVEGLKDFSMKPNEEVFIIGGSSIYEQFIPHAERLYITEIENSFDCDAFFPQLDWREWELIERKKGKECTEYDYYFSIFERRK